MVIPTGIKYAGVMLNRNSIDRTQHPLNFVEGKTVTAYFVGGRAGFLFFFVKSQDPKRQMKFERTPDIPAIADDGLAYGVASLKYFYSSLVF